MELTPIERVFRQLQGKDIDRPPCYSGMGNVTVTGLKQLGYKFPQVHGDPLKMANLAATSYELFEFECAVVPFDFCVEAEALGCKMNAYEDVEHLLYPTIKEKAVTSEAEMNSFPIPDDLKNEARIPVVVEAIRILKDKIGDKVAIGTYLTGPFTFAGQLFDLDQLFKLSFKKQKLVGEMLERLVGLLIELSKIYRAAGADYITVREMGATTDILSPRLFRSLILPPLKKMHSALNNAGIPNILHICGATNAIVAAMNEAGADAISVEAKNDLLKTREEIGNGPLVFGNLDAYQLFIQGSVHDVENAVIKALEEGVDAIWPGCDIWPEAKPENFKTMVEATKKYGPEKWLRRK